MNRATQIYADMLKSLEGYFRDTLTIQSKDGRRALRVLSVNLPPVPDQDDFERQKRARTLGITMSKPITAELELVIDNKVVDRKLTTLLAVPEVTQRGSYIVSGSEYIFPIQKRLLPGAYTTKKDSGSVETWLNSEAGRNYTVTLSQEGQLTVQVANQGPNIPLYPLLIGLGATDAQIQPVWGKEFLERVKSARGSKDAGAALKSFYEQLRYETDPEPATADVAGWRAWVLDYFDKKSKFDALNNEITMGKPYGKMSVPLLIDAGRRALGVMKEVEPEDNKESLLHAQFADLSDYAVERLRDRQFRSAIKSKLTRGVERFDKIQDIVYKEIFQSPFTSTFTHTSLARTPKQTNPMDMISGYTEVTVRGEGGIQTDQAITKDVRAVDPSHLGFFDPIHTPEGGNIGTTLHLATGARKVGKDLVTRVIDVKTGQEVEVTPRQFYVEPVCFAESYRGGKVVAEADGLVPVMWRHQDTKVKPSQVRYAIRSITDMLGVNAMASPYLTHNNGTRGMTASKMNTQAKPLKYREPPLVQCAIDEKSDKTIEQSVGLSFTPKSPVNGKVSEVAEGKVIIVGDDGKSHTVGIPKNFWLNEGNFMDSDVLVKPGDQVKKDQPLADTNYTKGGQLALGINLAVAYVPYMGYNHEDGIVISDGAATKLTSLHAHQNRVPVGPDEILDLKKFRAYFPTSFGVSDLANLDDEGIVKVGSRVAPGAPLVVKMRKVQEDVASKKLRSISRLLASDFRDTSTLWEKDHAGEVVEVTKRRGEVFIVVRTEERARVGDKLVGRYGNKGTITMILPDSKMPKNEDGKVLDILLNPQGVAARMNPGQLLETNAGRVAQREGKVYVARPHGENGSERVLNDLKRHGLSDASNIYDPETDSVIENVTSGIQYFKKLEHQVEKKMSVRGAGDDEAYSLSGQPSSGGGTGGRAVGLGEMYALLAHGAQANLRDMYTFKGDKQPEVWRAIEKGYPLPAVDQPASSKRFVGMLRGMGINLEQEGTRVKTTPFLDRDVKKISNGEITSPGVLRAGDLKEEKGGLFDLKVTGGLDGDKWSHIRLASPMPHPTFEKSILDLLKIKDKEFDQIMAGKLAFKDGQLVPPDTKDALTGGDAIRAMLGRIDVDARLIQAHEEALKARGSDLNKLNREMRILRNLRDNNVKPGELVVDLVPVVPPRFRPVAELPGGSLSIADVNEHYRGLVLMNDMLKQYKGRVGLEEQAAKIKSELYEGIRGTMGFSSGLVGNPNVKGLSATLAGTQPKSGLIGSQLLRRKQDASGTAVVEPEPKLSMDQIGVPEEMAWEAFRPFATQKLIGMGFPKLEADRQLDKRTDAAKKALEAAMQDHMVIANRAPTLHRWSMMAFKPILVAGSAVKLPVEVLSGYNADFDGDSFGIHVTATPDATKEAEGMLPSRNLYAPGRQRGSLMPQITQEFILGLYRISRPVRTTSHVFNTTAEVVRALESRQVKPDDIISVRANGVGRTTPGLVLIMEKVPQSLRNYQKMLDKKQVSHLLMETEKQFGAKAFVALMDHMKHEGRRWAYLTGSSILLSDMKSLSKERDQLYREADRKADVVRRNPKLSQAERDKRLIEIYSQVDSKVLGRVHDLPPNSSGHGNNLTDQIVSGARGNPNQAKQLVGTLGLMMDHQQKVIPEPVRGNYMDGLSSRDFWAHTPSQRKGMIDRSQSVIGPGALSKELTNTASRYPITVHDCKTQSGRMEPVDSHLIQRTLARPAASFQRNFAIDAKALDELKRLGIKEVFVRSPLTCEAPDGLCAMCFGKDEYDHFPPVGKHVGISEVQSITERSIQLPMKSFHCNHPKTLVFVRNPDGVEHAWTMERLYHAIACAPYVMDGVEMKWCPGGWEIWDQAGWVPLLRVARHAPDAPMVQIKTKSSHFVVCQDNHPLMARKLGVACEACASSRLKVEGTGRKQSYAVRCMDCDARGVVDQEHWKASRVVAVEAGQLEEGDVLHVSMPVRQGVPSGALAALPLDAWLLGFMLAEGSFGVRREKTVKREAPVVRGVVARGGHACTALHLSQLPGAVYEEASRRLTVGNVPHARYPRGLVVHDSSLAQELMRLTGSGAWNKEIPSEIITSGDDRALSLLLCGWIDGDGCVLAAGDRSSARVVATSTSLALIQGFHLVCTRLGLMSSVDSTSERDLTRHQAWSLSIRPTPEQASILESSIKCQGVVWTASVKEEAPASFDTGVAYIKPLQGQIDMVYDVTTGTGTFCANGVWTHNSGGVATAEGGLADAFSRAVQILRMPDQLRGAALLSTQAGRVTAITPNALGGNTILINNVKHEAKPGQQVQVKIGDEVKLGDKLTSGVVKPQELLQLRGMSAVQTQVRDDLFNTFASADVKLHKRTYEVMVRGLTDTVRITDPGQCNKYVVGDYTTFAQVKAWNDANPGKRQIKFNHELAGSLTAPTRTNDWAQRAALGRIQQTFQEAAGMGYSSERRPGSYADIMLGPGTKIREAGQEFNPFAKR